MRLAVLTLPRLFVFRFHLVSRVSSFFFQHCIVSIDIYRRGTVSFCTLGFLDIFFSSCFFFIYIFPCVSTLWQVWIAQPAFRGLSCMAGRWEAGQDLERRSPREADRKRRSQRPIDRRKQ